MTLTFEGEDRDLPSLGPREKLAGVLGSPHPFAMHKRYARDDSGKWQQGFRTIDVPKGHSKRIIPIVDNAKGAAKKKDDDKRPELVREQWINAFAFSQKEGFKTKWLFEAFVDADGHILVNPKKSKKSKNKTKKENLVPKGNSKSKRVNELFGLVNGRHQAYWFVGTRHRLSVKAIDRYEAIPELFRKVTLFTFLPRLSMTGLSGTGANVIGYVETDGEDLAIPVDSPLEVGKYLHRDLKHWQDEQIRVNGGVATTTGATYDVKPSAQNTRDLNRYAVSKFVAHYGDDKQIGADLRSCLVEPGLDLSGGGLNEAKDFAHRFEVKREQVARILEMVAADLCHWIDHFIFRIAREEMEKDEDHILIPDMAKCIEGLVGSLVGAKFLLDQGDLLEADTSDPLHKVVFATSPLDGAATKITGTVLSSAVTVLGAYQAVRLTETTRNAEKLLEKINGHASKLLSADEVLSISERDYLTLVRSADTAKDVNPSKLYDIGKARAKLIEAKPDLSKPAAVQSALGTVIHLFNIGCAVRAYASVPHAYSAEKKASRDAMILTGVQITTSIVRKMILDRALSGGSRRLLLTGHALGFISSAVTLFNDFRSVTGLAKAGDTDAAVALLTSSLLGLTSNAVALAASIFWRSHAVLRLASNIVALALAIAAVVAYFFYLYFKDSDLEKFFKNCRFGKNAGLGGSDKPTWSTATLGEMHESWSAQLDAIFALSRGFALKVYQRRVPDHTGVANERFDTRVMLDPGELFEDDSFVVTWWWRTLDDREKWESEEVIYFPISKKMGDNGLVGQGWGRNVRLYPPSHVHDLEQSNQLVDLTVLDAVDASNFTEMEVQESVMAAVFVFQPRDHELVALGPG